MQKGATREAGYLSQNLPFAPVGAVHTKCPTRTDFLLIILARIQIESVNFKRYKRGSADAPM